jgi:3-deoxy-manno-octulosonate cytidylyltransferase (CMP-KDO synthetase)
MKAIGIIPARFYSTRFPGKALAQILDQPMIYWVVEAASGSKLLDRVIVATDDERIAKVVRNKGGEAVMTSPDHQSGSDRVWEAAKKLEADYIVNIQGDEPTITGEVLDSCLMPLMERNDIDVSTLKTSILNSEELLRSDVVKVVTDKRGFALYFSRSPIPYTGEVGADRGLHFRHVGIYAYSREALKRFCGLPVSKLEKAERLEQLRGLEAGMRYYVVQTKFQPFDVNTPSDIEVVEQTLRLRAGEA